jgi:23S rRNA (cytosine1962-C5)-methyltransferase
MDPPSYGRGPKGELWKIEDHLHDLVKLTASLLSEQPLFYLINSYTTGLAPGVLTYLISTEVVKRFGGVVDSQEVGLPVSDSALYLPCGAAGRWQAKDLFPSD